MDFIKIPEFTPYRAAIGRILEGEYISELEDIHRSCSTESLKKFPCLAGEDFLDQRELNSYAVAENLVARGCNPKSIYAVLSIQRPEEVREHSRRLLKTVAI
jgi:hypothetical protein